MISGAIFDIDGTILDSMQFWAKAPEPFLNNIGIELAPEVGKLTLFMGLPEIADFLKKEYRLDMSVDAIIEGITETIKDYYKYQVQLKEGAERFLTDMKQAGMKITAATFSERYNVENALKRLNALKYFDIILTCTEVGAGKEKPDVYLAAARYMGTLPMHTWVFEDALYALKTAKNAGFKTVGVYDVSSIEDQPEIKKACDIYLEKLDGVDICNFIFF